MKTNSFLRIIENVVMCKYIAMHFCVVSFLENAHYVICTDSLEGENNAGLEAMEA